ncbi:MAG: hypothetical protein ACNS64_01230 [Candidatus Halalkalibacterium sp. M3_1C_030]
MAVRRNGITDEFIIETSGGTDITSQLGPYQTVSWTINKNQEKEGSVGQQPEYVDIIDGVVDIDVELSVDAPDLDGLDTITGNFQDDPPEFTIKVPTETESGEEKILVITGVKFEASLEVSDEELVSIDYSGIGLEVEEQSGTLNTPKPDNTKALTYLDVYYKIDGEDVDAVDSFNVDFSRDLRAERGMKPVTSEDQRPFHDEIIPGMKDFSGTLDIQVTDDMATKHFFDDTTEPKQFDGSQRTLIPNMKLVDDKNGKELVLSNLQFEEISMTQEPDTELRVISSPFDCLDATIQTVT